MTERQAALLHICRVLGNPMFGLSKPDREKAIEYAEQFQFTVREVIEASNDIALRGGLSKSF